MKHRPLGSTGILVSEVGFGCWQLGGEGWGPFRTDDGIRAVRRALDLGISLFDTAPVYGFGRSEEVLGKALGRDFHRVTVISKAGLVWDANRRVAHDNSPASIRRSLEGTLRRLRAEFLGVLLLHWPDPAVPLEESLGTLRELRRAGKIRAWGLSNHPADQVLSVEELLEEAARCGEGPVLEYPANVAGRFACEYEASGEAGEELRLHAERRGWGFVAFDVLMRGALGGRMGPGRGFGKRDIRSADRRYQGAELSRTLELASRLTSVASDLGVPPAALAIRAVLERAGVSSCLVGMKSPQQVEECVRASELVFSEEAAARLKDIAELARRETGPT